MNLFSQFENSSKKFSTHNALFVDNKFYTYNELQLLSGRIAAILKDLNGSHVAVLSNRSLTGYTGILAALQVGKTYVPLNSKVPITRNKRILKNSTSKIIIIDDKCLQMAKDILQHIKENYILIFPETSLEKIPLDLQNLFTVYSKEELKTSQSRVTDLSGNENAYIIFTSGSTGEPKGVPVSHNNVLAYIKNIYEKYNLTEKDRFSQTADISFDLSVHEIFLAWAVGAALYCIPREVLMAPANFIRQNALTVWTSVPSVANIMYKYKMLRPGVFSSLRYSFFCGEPLTVPTAVSWQKAASNCQIENIYGPTETTVGVTIYSLPKDPKEINHINNVVAIGEIFSNHQWCLVNENNYLSEEEGELCVAGVQVTKGYWRDSDLTLKKYITIGSSDELWYKTGDIIKRVNEIFYFISRKDLQVKLRGYRIELEEINYFISQYIGGGDIYTLPYPVDSGFTEGLHSFISSSTNFNEKDILTYLSKNLPIYMVPKNIFFIDKFPLNHNGKVDKNQLINILKQKK